jgi:hypothetical protein
MCGCKHLKLKFKMNSKNTLRIRKETFYLKFSTSLKPERIVAKAQFLTESSNPSKVLQSFVAVSNFTIEKFYFKFQAKQFRIN